MDIIDKIMDNNQSLEDMFGPPIYSYTREDAVRDGMFIKLAQNMNINTETAVRLAPPLSESGQVVDMQKLWFVLNPILEKYLKGIYYDVGATKYPEEMTRSLALYNVTEANGASQVLWFEHNVFFFPEYR